jgi:hypothetical protein
VAVCVVERLTAAACQAEPFQYRLSALRLSVNVALLAFMPRLLEPPPSATLPLKLVGNDADVKLLPLEGEVTDAVTGAVAS